MKHAAGWMSISIVALWAATAAANPPSAHDATQLRKSTSPIEQCKLEFGESCKSCPRDATAVASTPETAGIGSRPVFAAAMSLFDTSGFPPRWRCGTWSSFQGWLHIVSDVLIWLSYVAIPVTLVHFARRRHDVPFQNIFFLFGAFIILCGFTHLLEAVIFWWPVYRLLGAVKAVTALVSIATVVSLVPVVPKALSLKSPAQLTREIDHRKRVEAALRKSEQRFTRAVAGSTDGLWDWDFSTNHVWYSARCTQLVGLDKSDSSETLEAWRRRLHPDDAPAVIGAIRAHLETGAPCDVEYRLHVQDQGHCWFRSRGVAFRNGHGEAVHMSGSIQNIHARKMAELALREKEQEIRHQQKMEAVGSLAGGVAHEFNNMLQAIRGLMCFAMDEVPEGGARDDLQHALDTTERAAALTQQLLNFSRRDTLSPTHVHPNEVVQELARIMRPLIGENVELVVSLGDDIGMIYADANQLQQALMNLCINARDAMPSGGKLVISTQNMQSDDPLADDRPDLASGRFVQILITDDGCGIPLEIQERMFEPFFTTKPVGEGTGLGLAIVYGVVKQHHGIINVHTEANMGTTFEICLPIESQRTPCEQMQRENDCDQLRGNCETILIAEDDAIVREVEVRILERAGYRTIAVTNGEDAVQAFQQNAEDIDLVMLDVNMPHMSGHEAHSHIQQIRPAVPVIFCTGYDPNAAQTECLVQEGFSVVRKPFEINSLLKTVRDNLRMPLCTR